MNAEQLDPVLLTGATGFVGRALYPRLVDAGHEVLCATRSVKQARSTYPDRNWIQVDVERPASVAEALDRCQSAFYLIHQMTGQTDYVARERRSARRFCDAASSHDLARVVYLGGVSPKGPPSKHLG
ncbi:MAG: NAD-dependent epimerase/dehydratase family protein [Bradymonadaceae bacterium]